MKKIFKEDIQAVKTALKAKDLRPNVKIELQDLLESFEKQLQNDTKTTLQNSKNIGFSEENEIYFTYVKYMAKNHPNENIHAYYLLEKDERGFTTNHNKKPNKVIVDYFEKTNISNYKNILEDNSLSNFPNYPAEILKEKDLAQMKTFNEYKIFIKNHEKEISKQKTLKWANNIPARLLYLERAFATKKEQTYQEAVELFVNIAEKYYNNIKKNDVDNNFMANSQRVYSEKKKEGVIIKRHSYTNFYTVYISALIGNQTYDAGHGKLYGGKQVGIKISYENLPNLEDLIDDVFSYDILSSQKATKWFVDEGQISTKNANAPSNQSKPIYPTAKAFFQKNDWKNYIDTPVRKDLLFTQTLDEINELEREEENAEIEVKGTDYTQADQDEYLNEIFNQIKLGDEKNISTENLKLAIENLFLDKITKKRLEQLLKEREEEKKTPSTYFLDKNLPNFQGNITEYSLRNPQTEVYNRAALFGADQKMRKEMEINQKWIWSDTLKYLADAGIDTGQNVKSVQSPADFEKTIGYWQAEAEPSIFFNIKSANSGDKWEKICALTHFAEDFRQDAFIVKHKIPKEVAETLLDDEENYLKEFENGFILMPEVAFVFENLAKEDVFTIEKEILQVFGDFTIFTEVKEKDGTTQFSVSFFHQTNTTNENDKRKEISQAYERFEAKINGLRERFTNKKNKNIQGVFSEIIPGLDLSRLFCADNMGSTSSDLRPYTSVRKEINKMLTKYGRNICTYQNDKSAYVSAVAIEREEEKVPGQEPNQMWLSLQKQLIKEAAKGYDHFNLWYAETFLLKKGNRDTHKYILATLNLKENAYISDILEALQGKENDPQTIAELVAWVQDNPKSNELKSVVYGEVTGVQAAAIEKATNIDILGFERVLDSYGIKHILKNHGKASEELRGQEPITVEDFKKIPDVVENYDKVFVGGISKKNKFPMIAYVKRVNGVILVIEEQRESKEKHTKKVPVLTMMKFKVGEKKSPEELMLSIEKVYTQNNTSPTLTSNTLPGQANVTKKTDKPKLSIAERIDALKIALKYAKKEAKQSLLERIEALKISLKYTK